MGRHLLAMFVLAFAASASFAQPTAFTYQGQLKSNDSPANGVHDLRFLLFNAAIDGSQVGTTQCVDNVQVVNGAFTATLDFGNQFATTGQRFIEIEVRSDTGLGCGDATGFTKLAPRQPITPAPTAIQAKSAFTLASADGSNPAAVIVDNAGKVGVGTLLPTHTLHLASPAPTLALQDTDSTTQQVGYISYRDSGNVERAWMGYGSTGDPDFTIFNTRPSGDLVLLTAATGNVGIGTASPAAKLDVRGDIRLGSTGQFFANATEENLRTVRGVVGAAGTVFAGAGWTVTRPSTGRFDVTFTTGFSSTPTYVATAGSTGRTVVVGNVTNNSCTFFTYDVGGSPVNTSVNFIAIGPR